MLQRDEIEPGQFAHLRFKIPAEGEVDDDERGCSAVPEGPEIILAKPGAAAAASDHHISCGMAAGKSSEVRPVAPLAEAKASARPDQENTEIAEHVLAARSARVEPA